MPITDQAPTHRLVAALCLLAPMAAAIAAPADAERDALARLAHELAVLEPLVAEAEHAANPATRVRFRYDWLREDLARIRAGVLEHALAERAEPRSVPPLRGDYRR